MHPGLAAKDVGDGTKPCPKIPICARAALTQSQVEANTLPRRCAGAALLFGDDHVRFLRGDIHRPPRWRNYGL